LPKTIESLGEVKPEPAYFAEENGKRTGFVFFDLKDTSDLVVNLVVGHSLQ